MSDVQIISTTNVIEIASSQTVLEVSVPTVSVLEVALQGPAGSQGAQGSQGPAGADGADADTSLVVPYTGATDDVDIGNNDLTVGGNVASGSTPTYSQSRRLKIFDDGVNGAARVSLIGTDGNLNGPALEMVIGGDATKRTLVRMDDEGSNDYGLTFFTTNNGAVAAAMTLTGNSNLTVAGDVEATGSANGLVLESPDATRWRIKVDNAGNLTTESL